MLRRNVLIFFVSIPICSVGQQTQLDQKHQLIQSTQPDGTVLEYTYDKVGNRKTYTIQPGTPQQAELEWQNVLPTTFTLEAGATETISGTVLNSSATAAGGHYSRVYLSANTQPSGAALASTFTSGLAGNGTVGHSFTVTIPASTTPGPYNLVLYTDEDNTVPEADNTGNNIAVIPLTVLPPPPLPDVAVLNASIPQSSVAASGSITLSADVQNVGTNGAGEFHVQAYLSSNPTLELYQDLALTQFPDTVDTLAISATVPHAGTLVIPGNTTPGSYYLLLAADPTQSLQELETTNNTVALVLQVTANPNPPVAAFEASSTLLCNGETVQFTDLSDNGATSWSWSFPGGTPSSSTDQHPSVVYDTPGVYDVSLIATNGNGNSSTTATDYIAVGNGTVGNIMWNWVTEESGATPTDIETDANGNIYMTGYFSGSATVGGFTLSGTGTRSFLAKYNSQGICQWAVQAGANSGAWSFCHFTSLAIDASGNVFVAGWAEAPDTYIFFGSKAIYVDNNDDEDAFVVKYNSSGTVLWVKSTGYPDKDVALDITVDAAGYCYPVGYLFAQGSPTPFGFSAVTTTIPNTTNRAGFAAKISSSGSVQWTEDFYASNYGEVEVYSAAVDGYNRLVITGQVTDQTVHFGSQSATPSGSNDIFIAGVQTSNGSTTYLHLAGGNNSSSWWYEERGFDVKADPFSNSCYVTGMYYQTVNFLGTVITGQSESNLFLAKITNGNLDWVKTAGGYSVAEGKEIAIDNAGNILVHGYHSGDADFDNTTLSGGKYFFAKYQPDGTLLWAQNAAGNEGGAPFDRKGVIACDNQGNSYYAKSLAPVTLGGQTYLQSNGTFFLAQFGPFSCPDTLPLLTHTGPMNLCTGIPDTLTAPAGYTSFSWSNGATTQRITVSEPGQYYCLVSSCDGCSAYTDTITITGGSPPMATISTVGNLSLCQGDSVQLNSSTGSNLQYQWLLNGNPIVGANLTSHYATQAGNYSVEITSETGCTTTSNILFVSVSAAADATVTAQGGTTICAGNSSTLATVPATGAAYQWFVNGTLMFGETSHVLSVNNAGNYSVAVETSQGCRDTSQVLTITVLPAPDAAFTAVENCSTTDFAYLGPPGTNTLAWDLDGNGSTDQTAEAFSHAYNPPTQHTVTLTATAPNGCSNTISQTVNPVYVPPTQVLSTECGALLSTMNQYFHINTVVGATNYEYEFVNFTTGDTTYAPSLPSDPDGTYFAMSFVPNVQYSTHYIIRVRAKLNGIWGCFAAPCTLTTPLTIPGPELTAQFCNGQLSQLNHYFYWNSVPGAQRYQLWISDLNGFDAYPFSLSQTPTGTFLSMALVPGIQYNNTYTIRIRAKVGGVWGSWGSACTLATPLDSPQPQVESKLCNKTMQNLSDYLYCIPINGAQRYYWEIHDPISNFTAYSASPSYAPTATFLALSTIPGIAYNTTYEVRVKAKLNGVWGNWGPICHITTPFKPAAKLGEDAIAEITVNNIEPQLLITPNPSSSAFRLTMVQDCEPGTLKTATLYDLAGQIVAQKHFSGTWVDFDDAGSLPKGVYSVVVVCKTTVLAGKVIIN